MGYHINEIKPFSPSGQRLCSKGAEVRELCGRRETGNGRREGGKSNSKCDRNQKKTKQKHH